MYGFYVQDDYRVTREADAQPGPALRVRGRALGPPVPAAAAAGPRPTRSPAWRRRSTRKIPADVRAMMAESAGAEELHLQRRVLLHGGGQQAQDGRLDAAASCRASAWPGGSTRRPRSAPATAASSPRPRSPTPSATPWARSTSAAFSPITNVLPTRQRRSAVAYLANPFPQGLTPAYGKSYGRYTQPRRRRRDGRVRAADADQRPHQRLASSASCPAEIVADATYFMNFISRDQYSQNLNMMDPRLALQVRRGARRRRCRTRSSTTARSRRSPGRCAARRPSRRASCCALPAVRRHHPDRHGLAEGALPVAAAPPAAAVRQWLLVPGHLRLRRSRSRSGTTTRRTSTTAQLTWFDFSVTPGRPHRRTHR